MKPKNLLSIMLLWISEAVFCQANFATPPNYALIKANIENKSSNYYYPSLIKRLQENDTMLNLPEYLHAYYGTALQKDYKPYGLTSQDEKLHEFYKKDSLVGSEVQDYIKVARKALQESPVDLGLMLLLAYAYHQSGDDATAIKISANVRGLLTAILTTGDGQRCESAFHVIAISHEYVMLNLFGLETTSQTLSGNCDYLEFKGHYKFPGVYFDVSRLKE